MPNGGSDCCGTCWFNARNKGEAGYAHTKDPEPNFCTIRGESKEITKDDIRVLAEPNFCTIRGESINNSFWTYCGNHPHRRPQRDPIPIGPIFVDQGSGRKQWKPSPDSDEVRRHLLELAAAIAEQPADEYPAGASTDELVVWQLGEFREQRALPQIQRIVRFSLAAAGGKFGRTRESLVRTAQDALAKIQAGGEAAE